jgi:tryptophan synthase alpha subunit
VVQHANQTALDRGITVRKCMDITRASALPVPAFAMGYLNPVLSHGEAAYARDWHAAGASGLIIPDLPPEESHEMLGICNAHDMALIQFVAPTSTPSRIALSTGIAMGFIYVVAVAGTTGARSSLANGLKDYVLRIKAAAKGTPVVVGFGISTREQVREVGEYADGVIVASALLRAAGEAPDPAQAAYDFVRELRHG